jgi:hypothetical protein
MAMNGKCYRYLVLSGMLLLAAGCRTNVRVEPPDSEPPATNANNNSGERRESGVANMARFQSEQEFREYFAGQLTLSNDSFDRLPPGGMGDQLNANASAPPVFEGAPGAEC